MMLRIAICDDEAEAVAIVKRLLQQSFAERGIEAECTTYTSAEVLLKVIRNGTHYDLLLLDIDMPQMDGIELGMAVQELLLDKALDIVTACPCEHGCPSCAGPVGEIGENGKKTSIAILTDLVERNQRS